MSADDGRVLLQNPKGLFCDSSAKGFKQHPYMLMIPPVPYCLLNHMMQVAEQLAQRPGPVKEPSVPGPTQSSSFRSHLVDGWSNTHKRGMCCFQSPQRPAKHYAYFLVVGEARYKSFSFIFSSMPHTAGLLRISLRQKGLDFLLDLFSID